MTSLVRPFASHAVLRSDGSVGMVDTLGQPMADDAEIVVTARTLAKLLADHVMAGVQVGHRDGTEATATAALQAGAAAVAVARKAGAQAGAQAGVKAGARWVMANTRVRRVLERDAQGQVAASVESREPVP